MKYQYYLRILYHLDKIKWYCYSFGEFSPKFLCMCTLIA